ncbi:hypothetical protein IKD57_02525 [Candidatus Saccharibacteria bacterium]|nr:hypothetical protein [Candidatus Saccharibacteria bacterium]
MNKRLFVLGAFVSILCCTFGINTVQAERIPESNPIFQKIIYTGALDCYEATPNEGGMAREITLRNFDGTYNSLRDTVTTSGMGTTDYRDDYTVKWYGLASENNEVACGDLLTNKTAKKFLSSATTEQYSDRAKLLESMQYSKSSSGEVSNKKCYHFEYIYGDKDTRDSAPVYSKNYTNDVCVDGSPGEWQLSVEGYDYASPHSNIVMFDKGSANQIRVKTGYSQLGGIGYHKELLTFSNAQSAADVLASIGNKIAEMLGSTEDNSTKEDGNGSFAYASCGGFEARSNGSGINCPNNPSQDKTFSSTNEADSEYKKITLRTDASKNRLVNSLSNGAYSYTALYSLTFAPLQKYELYQNYLTEVYGASSLNCYDNPQGGAGVGPIRLWWSAQNKYSDYCYAVIDDSKQNYKVNGVYSNGYFGLELTLQDMINQLNKLTLKSKPDSVIGSNDDSNKEDVNDASSPYDKCYEAGLDSQAWVICPAIRNMTESVSGMDNLVNSMLAIKTEDYQADGNTEGIWGVFRNIANTAMIVVLLVIIFSQLTGYGIDNYGIKKMLPKLILMAVLINLSFIICELAVDLSNIIGNGLYNLLRNLGEVGYTGDSASYSLANTVTQLLGVAAGAGAASGVIVDVAGAVAGGGGPMVILSIFLVVLAALIAVFMFFVMLGGRLVVVIFFTMISPLAFACYILPNTQGLFKKWWNIFKTALVVYPICGALYGLSYLIRGSLVGATDNFPMMLVAAISPFLPFLALPILLKGVMSTLGVIGNALTSLGNGIKNGISRGNQSLQSTNAYKNQKEDASRRQQENYANRWLRGYNRRKDRAGGDENMSKSQRLRAARYSEMLKKHESEDLAAQTVLAEEKYANASEEELQKRWEDAYASGSDELDALTNIMRSRYGAGAANFFSKAMGRNNLIGSDGTLNLGVAKSIRSMRDHMLSDKDLDKLMLTKTPDAHKMISSLGQITDKNGRSYYQNLDQFSFNNTITTKQADVAAATSSTIERMVESGGFENMLGAGAAEEMLNSTEPSVQAALTDMKKRRAVQAQAYLDAHGIKYDGSRSIEELAKAYTEEKGLKAAADQETRRNAEQRQNQATDQMLKELQDINSKLGHGGNSSSSNPGGDETNPIDGQLL